MRKKRKGKDKGRVEQRKRQRQEKSFFGIRSRVTLEFG